MRPNYQAENWDSPPALAPDQDKRIPYAALCRGASVYILLGKTTLAIEAAEIARLYEMEVAQVSADIGALVERDRRQVGGVFEDKTPRDWSRV